MEQEKVKKAPAESPIPVGDEIPVPTGTKVCVFDAWHFPDSGLQDLYNCYFGDGPKDYEGKFNKVRADFVKARQAAIAKRFVAESESDKGDSDEDLLGPSEEHYQRGAEIMKKYPFLNPRTVLAYLHFDDNFQVQDDERDDMLKELAEMAENGVDSRLAYLNMLINIVDRRAFSRNSALVDALGEASETRKDQHEKLMKAIGTEIALTRDLTMREIVSYFNSSIPFKMLFAMVVFFLFFALFHAIELVSKQVDDMETNVKLLQNSVDELNARRVCLL